MAKVWKPGENISYEDLNKLQEKADAYEKIMAEKKTSDKKQEAKGVDV